MVGDGGPDLDRVLCYLQRVGMLLRNNHAGDNHPYFSALLLKERRENIH